MVSGIGCLKETSEKCEPRLFRWNGVDPSLILLALVASIFIHAAVFSAFMVLVRPTHLVTPDDPYVYLTLTSSRLGIARLRGNDSGTSSQKSDKYLSKISRHPRRLNRAAHTEKPIRTRLALNSRDVESSSLTKSNAAPTGAAKTRNNNAVPSLRNEGHPFGSRAGDSIANAWPDSTSGTIVSQPPVLVSRTLPAYPERARRLGIEGQVVLQFVVDQFGRVERDIQVIDSFPMFDQAAIDAVRQWRFSPARDRNGNAVRVVISVPLQFNLR
jgi:TonB family protein